jgi:hypothetical protein
MNKEEFTRLIHEESYSEEDIQRIKSLKEEYPYFALPRFIELKISTLLGVQSSPESIARATVYASDRKHLYEWLNELADHERKNDIGSGSEIEFLDGEGNSVSDSSFELMSDEDRMETDADVVGVPEKDEADMEDPEIEHDVAIPSIDPIEDENSTDTKESQNEELIELESSIEIEAQPEKPVTPTADQPAAPVDHLLRNTFNEQATSSTKNSNGLIERFLEKDPGIIKADKETTLEGDVSTHSVKEDDSFITDTLAKIYVKQGLHAKAIYAYERLSLKYPEKSAYFAAQIEKIKENTNR